LALFLSSVSLCQQIHFLHNQETKTTTRDQKHTHAHTKAHTNENITGKANHSKTTSTPKTNQEKTNNNSTNNNKINNKTNDKTNTNSTNNNKINNKTNNNNKLAINLTTNQQTKEVLEIKLSRWENIYIILKS
jgi:uncharacterized protein involved in copper resistance